MAAKYQDIVTDLKQQIRQERYLANHRLPSYQELALYYGVSLITVRHAIDILCRDGWLAVERGRSKGAVVLAPHGHIGSEERNRPCYLVCVPLDIMSSRVGDFANHIHDISERFFQSSAICCVVAQMVNQDLLTMLRVLIERNRPDGIMVFPNMPQQTLEIFSCARSFKIPIVVAASAESLVSNQILQLGLPGVFVRESRNLLEMLRIGYEAGRRKLVVVNRNQETNLRIRELLYIIKADQRWQLKFLLQEDWHRTLPDFLTEAVTLARNADDTLLLIDGFPDLLSAFETILAAEGIVPGKDLHLAFFQHGSEFSEHYSSLFSMIRRSHREFGIQATEMLLNYKTEAETRIIDAELIHCGTL